MTAADRLTTNHGAAGFCTDHAQGADGRVETVARVVEFYATSKPPKALLDADPARAWREHYLAAARQILAAAVVAALDDETARLRASADAWWSEYDRELQAHEATKAEVARLTRIVNGYDRTPAEQRAADAEAEAERLRAGIAHIVDRYGNAPGIETCATMYDLRRLAGVTPTEGAHLRVLPRERYGAVMDSGPEEPR